jgi:small-conductance mechanosensitive channel
MTNYVALVPTFIDQVESRIAVLTPKLILALLILLICCAAGLIISGIIRHIAKRVNEGRQDILNLLARIIRIIMIVLGFVSALGTLGMNVMPIVTGLGLTGFALGFAFKDILSNTLAGVMIILYRPFSRGDVIAVAGYQGTVIRIDLRYTTIDTDSKYFLIPNTVLLTNAITIFDREP